MLHFLACMIEDFVLRVLVEGLFSQKGHVSAEGKDGLIVLLCK
jgi:hypothetical protein